MRKIINRDVFADFPVFIIFTLPHRCNPWRYPLSASASISEHFPFKNWQIGYDSGSFPTPCCKMKCARLIVSSTSAHFVETRQTACILSNCKVKPSFLTQRTGKSMHSTASESYIFESQTSKKSYMMQTF